MVLTVKPLNCVTDYSVEVKARMNGVRTPEDIVKNEFKKK